MFGHEANLSIQFNVAALIKETSGLLCPSIPQNFAIKQRVELVKVLEAYPVMRNIVSEGEDGRKFIERYFFSILGRRMDNEVQLYDSQLVKEQKLGQRPDLRDVVTLVLPHIQVRHWKRVGLALGMKKSTFDGLGQYSNDYSCYLKTLSYWLEHGSSVTWKTLLDVLDHFETKHTIDELTYTIVSELSVFPSILKSQTVESGVQTDEEQDGLWHPNAATVGGDVGAETDDHEYKSLWTMLMV